MLNSKAKVDQRFIDLFKISQAKHYGVSIGLTGLKDENNDKYGEESAMSLIADMTELAIDGEVAEPV